MSATQTLIEKMNRHIQKGLEEKRLELLVNPKLVDYPEEIELTNVRVSSVASYNEGVEYSICHHQFVINGENVSVDSFLEDDEDFRTEIRLTDKYRMYSSDSSGTEIQDFPNLGEFSKYGWLPELLESLDYGIKFVEDWDLVIKFTRESLDSETIEMFDRVKPYFPGLTEIIMEQSTTCLLRFDTGITLNLNKDSLIMSLAGATEKQQTKTPVSSEA